jgi:hypothetical protein
MDPKHQKRLFYNAAFILFYLFIYYGLGFNLTIIVMLAHILSEFHMMYLRMENKRDDE